MQNRQLYQYKTTASTNFKAMLSPLNFSEENKEAAAVLMSLQIMNCSTAVEVFKIQTEWYALINNLINFEFTQQVNLTEVGTENFCIKELNKFLLASLELKQSAQAINLILANPQDAEVLQFACYEITNNSKINNSLKTAETTILTLLPKFKSSANLVADIITRIAKWHQLSTPEHFQEIIAALPLGKNALNTLQNFFASLDKRRDLPVVSKNNLIHIIKHHQYIPKLKELFGFEGHGFITPTKYINFFLSHPSKLSLAKQIIGLAKEKPPHAEFLIANLDILLDNPEQATKLEQCCKYLKELKALNIKNISILLKNISQISAFIAGLTDLHGLSSLWTNTITDFLNTKFSFGPSICYYSIILDFDEQRMKELYDYNEEVIIGLGAGLNAVKGWVKDYYHYLLADIVQAEILGKAIAKLASDNADTDENLQTLLKNPAKAFHQAIAICFLKKSRIEFALHNPEIINKSFLAAQDPEELEQNIEVLDNYAFLNEETLNKFTNIKFDFERFMHSGRNHTITGLEVRKQFLNLTLQVTCYTEFLIKAMKTAPCFIDENFNITIYKKLVENIYLGNILIDEINKHPKMTQEDFDALMASNIKNASVEKAARHVCHLNLDTDDKNIIMSFFYRPQERKHFRPEINHFYHNKNKVSGFFNNDDKFLKAVMITQLKKLLADGFEICNSKTYNDYESETLFKLNDLLTDVTTNQRRINSVVIDLESVILHVIKNKNLAPELYYAIEENLKDLRQKWPHIIAQSKLLDSLTNAYQQCQTTNSTRISM